MKKFRCTVTREDEYIIELDDKNLFTKEWMEDFKKHFYNFNTLKEHAEHIAWHKSRSILLNSFIEGYGVPLINGKTPPFTHDGSIERGVNIQIISEDENYEVDVEEIK